MPDLTRIKAKPKTRVTIERRNGQLVRVVTDIRGKQRDWTETVRPYNPLPNLAPVPSIWPRFA